MCSDFPAHFLVWKNDFRELDTGLGSYLKAELERVDPRGRTPLMLAVTLGHVESTRVLLRHNANVNVENKGGWTVLQEAVATGDPELVHLVLEKRDFQRHSSRSRGIPALLHRLCDAPDFYVEMKWEFTSWVPLVSRMCPSDTYKVYKQGSKVRIDTTLLGFDQNNWQRGNRSYIFKGQGDSAVMMEVDHETHQVYSEQMKVLTAEEAAYLSPTHDNVSARLTTPLVLTYIDTDKICFERSKSGIWGWRSERSEDVNGRPCKVFSASNVELVTKTRTEHLTEADKSENKMKNTPLAPFQSFLGIAEQEERTQTPDLPNGEILQSRGNPCHISPEEYFDADADLGKRDIGRPKEVSRKTQKFKANLWLCEDYPLSLPEQIMPVVDLMSMSSSHFAKLKDFIQLQLPSGFPVKIEIPLFHVLNACITFGNIFGLEESIEGVTSLDADRLSCVIDDSCFEAPAGYTRLGSDFRRQYNADDEDELLQFAIQQSLIDAGTEHEQVDIWEALKAQKPSPRPSPTHSPLPNEEEAILQRVIAESLSLSGSDVAAIAPEDDWDLTKALQESQRQQEEEDRLRKEEEEMLQRVLQLSLSDH